MSRAKNLPPISTIHHSANGVDDAGKKNDKENWCQLLKFGGPFDVPDDRRPIVYPEPNDEGEKNFGG
jgi:hypothetical protein